jgi:hypothetical protein
MFQETHRSPGKPSSLGRRSTTVCLFVCNPIVAYPEISPTLIMQGIEGMMLADTFAKNSTEHQEISNPFRL